MNPGLRSKTIREVWPAALLFTLGIAGFEAVLAAVLPTFHEQLEQQILQMPFIRNVLRALLGTDIGDRLGPMAVASIAWVHPVVLSLVFAHAIIHCTRLPAGEIDRGTVDVLLSLPVSRWSAFRTESAAFVVTGAALLAGGLIGHLLGSRVAPPSYAAAPSRLLIVLANLFGLYLAIGGVGYLVSSLSDRRGRAIGTAFAFVVLTFFLQVVVQFWRPAEAIAFLGLLHYYRPLDVLQQGTWPLADLAVLGAIAAALWALAGCVFARRDIRTV